MRVTPGVLHNMSVPPWSRLQVARAHFKGKRFAVQPFRSPAYDPKDRIAIEKDVDAKFAEHGAAYSLALLSVRFEPEESYSRRLACRIHKLADDPTAPERFASVCEEALKQAGVPDALGVFMPQDQQPTGLRRRSMALELALLARRSGFIYLPQRPIDASLISWSSGVFLFPAW
jgi:hypothetical protein